jgi:hypothetical protein
VISPFVAGSNPALGTSARQFTKNSKDAV